MAKIQVIHKQQNLKNDWEIFYQKIINSARFSKDFEEFIELVKKDSTFMQGCCVSSSENKVYFSEGKDFGKDLIIIEYKND